MADLDVTQLELITPHVTTQLQAFNSQVVAHLKNYKPEISRIYDRLGELTVTDERLEGHLNALESDVNRNNDNAVSSYNSLAERLGKVEQLLSALPSWKDDLVGRIENLARETRAKHEAAASRATVIEDSLNSHIAATRERLDMLTTVARTASEARAQQQERIDELDTELRRLREFAEKEFNDAKIRLRRHDEQHVVANGKLAEHGGMLSSHKIELARLKDSSDQHNRQLENLARGPGTMLDIKVETGPPGLWKMASQVAAHEDEIASMRTGLMAAKSTNEELTRRMDDVLSGLAHQRDTSTQLREECRILADRLTALAGSGERLKFELLHDETAQVGTIRDYMAEVERRNAALTERVMQLEAGLAGESERSRSVAGVTRELRAAIDGMLCTSQADLARLRATMSSLHEEYAEMSKKARRAGLMTVSQVEDIIDMRLNGPVLDSIIAKKVCEYGCVFRKVVVTRLMMRCCRLRRGHGTFVVFLFSCGPSWQPSSMQRQLTFGSGGGGDGIASAAVSISGEAAAVAAAGTGPGSLASPPLPPSVAMSVAEEATAYSLPGSPSPRAAAAGGVGVGVGSSDPALGLRLVTVESDMSRLFEAFKAFGEKVAPISEIHDLRQDLEDINNIVTQIKVGQGILGEAGEEAVRRHIHATLLPDLQQRQQQDTRRILGWMDEQLADVSKELYIIRRNQERIQSRMAELNGAGGGGGAAAAAGVAEAAAEDAAAAAAAAARLAATASSLRPRHIPGRPMSASAALMSASSSAAFAALYGDGEAVGLTARVEALAEQLYFISDTLGVPLGRKSRPAQARARKRNTAGGGGGGQQALAAAAAVTTTMASAGGGGGGGGAAAAVGSLRGYASGPAMQLAGSASVAAASPPPAATAAAVQGLVDAAVAELKLRLRLIENEVPLMARSFEVKALKRMLHDATAAAAAAAAAGAPAAAPPLGMFDSNSRTSSGVMGLPPPPLNRLRSNASTRWSWQLRLWTSVDEHWSKGGLIWNLNWAALAKKLTVVNVEISGIAHDLAVAAHEELQRSRDGPLPDGTQDGIPTPAAVANREAALARLRRKPLEVAAHVELLESVKLHLDRLMRRSTACTTDRLVLLAAMGAMRIKLLENEAEAFREQIIAVFRSLERAFTALVKLQEAVATKSSAAAVGQLATMLQDVSAGLATLAAHAAIRDSAVTGPMVPRGGSGAAAVAVTAAAAAVEQVRRRQGSAGSSDVAAAAAAAASGNLTLPAPLANGPLEETLSMLTARVPSPTSVMRPASPVRLAGPGINTAINRQHAAAARGGGGGGGGAAAAAAAALGGGVRLTSTQGTPVVTVLNQSCRTAI
ncbi:hypothetical protein VOLCADRAFT_91393 [Volvox carteri f. nagariensis]|uniref:Uncharacterized protein n=1 Tax=Volvox carteri f. nagariensis TaxID=3068 RepID=D8TWY5_VOLCA|nr:uncharacterized protein VOLCADRAFT_91393 [Volvox carteri f. nagariensis]EFJ47917.1 hypothetical protein VOLCADRAFT_91393 [Volvox carteri f. nagariensis]|eukprot:XP_002951023.1 hypothetical protein VOLCADRAFT_91393 [Volvox carteri f. nagariensis]